MTVDEKEKVKELKGMEYKAILTLYEDCAINETLFHWQSQSRTSVESETGQRYINHLNTGSKIILFVRENKRRHGFAAPYTYFGEAEYVSHSGSMPISFV